MVSHSWAKTMVASQHNAIDEPLLTKPFCEPQDISDNSLSKITACICDSDLCNSYRGPGEKKPDLLPVHILTQNDPIPLNQAGRKQSLVPEEETRKASIPRNNKNKNKVSRKESDSLPDKNPKPQSPGRTGPRQTFHPDQPGLRCYSCGSLLNPNKKCDTFNREDKNQVQTCLKDEACLMYSWTKSSTQTGEIYISKFD